MCLCRSMLLRRNSKYFLVKKIERPTNPCAQIYRQKYLSKDTDIMISANEHFDLALDVTRALARTQPSGDDDHQSIDYSDADVIKYSATEKAYVRSFVFSLFLSSFFLVRPSLTCFYSFLFRSLARRYICLLYTSPSPRDLSTSRMPSSA